MREKIFKRTTTNYSYNSGNHLVEELTNGQTVSYIYNVNGDLEEETTGEKYSYDIQGNLTSITGNGIDQSFTYNGNGMRLSKTGDGETTYYVNDINRSYEEVLQTYDEDGNTINTYTYGVQRISSEGETNETYLYDGRGSVVGTVNQDDILTSYSYTAYGDLMPDSPEPSVYGYNAEATDYKTGLQYLRARYYNVEVQRFIQEDDYKGDFVSPASLNRYNYVQGNPVKYSDPSGYRRIEYGPRVAKPKAPLSLPPKPALAKKRGNTDTGGGYTPKSLFSSNSSKSSSEELSGTSNPRGSWEIFGQAEAEIYSCGKGDEEAPSSATPAPSATIPTPTANLPKDAPRIGTVQVNWDLTLAIGGMVPIVGPVFDVIDVYRSFKNNQKFWGIVGAIGVLPIGNLIAGIAKVAKGSDKAFDAVRAIKALSYGDELGDGVKTLNSSMDDILEGTGKQVDNIIREEIAELGANKINHILKEHHDWAKLVDDPKDWDEVSEIISKVLDEGDEGAYKSVLSKTLEIDGEIVEVTYTKLDDGSIKISDAWVKN